MKNLLIKLTLIATFVAASNTVSAAFSDSTNTYALWHCDATNWDGTIETTPDDNSSGRVAHPLQINITNEAVIMPGSPYGGSYLSMDGTDKCTAFGAYEGDKDNVNIDFSFRAHAFPAAGDYDVLISTPSTRIYLFGDVVRAIAYDDAAVAHFITSSKTLSLDTWYSVNLSTSNSNNQFELIVGNDTDGYTTTLAPSADNLFFVDGMTYILFGWDEWVVGREANADFDEIRIGSVTPDPPLEDLTSCIKDDNGSPTMFINDKPVAPMMFYGYAVDLPGNPNCEFAKQAVLAKNAGIHLYTFAINFQGIFGDGVTYWNTLDSIFTAVTNLDNEAMMIPRFYIYPSAWYMTANPDIHMEYSDGTKDRICLASEKWRTYMQARVGDFVSHCEDKFGNNIIGYHLTLMETGEWFYERSWENVFSGYSENMRLGFAYWVTNKYQTEAALKTAWNDSEVTFTNITLPTTSERSNSSSAFFRNPAIEMKVIDFYEYKNYLVPDTIELMSKQIKNSSSSNKLVVTFYGYASELSGVPKGPQITGHLAMKKLLKSPYIDIVASPISYGNRRPGGIAAFMSAADSVRAAGKLWFNEDDTRTYLNTASPHYPTLQQTQWAHDNSFARILSRRMGCWYMDLFNLGWLNSTGLWQNISKLQSIYESQLGVKSTWNPEVAVIIDERSTYYLACNNNLTSPLYSALRTRLYRMGVPFNIYLLEDVLDGSVDLPKVNIFLGSWYLTSSERTTLHSVLSGKAAIWFHGAGYINETGAAITNISDLTGFSFVEESGPAQITFVANSPWNDGLGGSSFKPSLFANGAANVFETMDQNINYDVRWAIDGGSATQLGTYNNGHTGLAVIDYSGFKSFYCGIAGIPSQFLRNVCKNMGVHVYVDDDYAMDTDGKFFSIDSPKVESQSIVLSNNNYLSCMNLGTFKTSSGGIVNDNFTTVGETRTCWIGTNSIGGFTDNIINKGLWHCDNSYSPVSSLISDDDNSSGRTAVNPVLNEEHIYTHVTAPMLMPNSPKGGNYFRFDGIDDNMIAQSAWTADSNTFSGNISLRWLDLPPVSDNVDGILVSQPWRLYLQNDGFGNGKLLFRVMNAAATGYTELESTVVLSSNVWYDINFEVFNNAVTLIVNGDSESTPLIGGMLNISSDVIAGWDAASGHYFKGDLDEVRFGAVIPEPGILWIVGLLAMRCIMKIRRRA